jgi:hypothetical protein
MHRRNVAPRIGSVLLFLSQLISQRFLGEHLCSFFAGTENRTEEGEYFLRVNLEDVEDLRLGQ